MSGLRLYCTYFDSAFLARGIAMLRSLRRHDPAARIFVLALDELCARVLKDQFGDLLRVIEADALHAVNPELSEIREERSAWAYYATQKPAFAIFAMASEPRPESLTYIDADTWFFSDPSPMFDELGAASVELAQDGLAPGGRIRRVSRSPGANSGGLCASVGLSPHRFHASLEHLAMYGIYNAGCIYWRNDDTGRRCVRDWLRDCLEWCGEQAQPDGRFMNQGYLNSWPGRYPDVHILEHRGLNLAPWNVDGHVLTRDGERITVDGQPLVFFHFSGMSRDAEGQWHGHYPRFERQFEFACDWIYRPYLRAVEEASRRLQADYGILGTGTVRSMAEWPAAVQFGGAATLS